jgi:hypothetical protein
MRMQPIVLLGTVALLLLSGCSSFNRQWRASLREPIPADDISGPWEGRWISDVNGHNGRLRCVISRQTNRYDAFFHAKYMKVFSFSYTVPLQVERNQTNFTFSGEEDLGKLAGGLYTYKGEATPEKFESTYKSKYDHGRFDLSRPLPKE